MTDWWASARDREIKRLQRMIAQGTEAESAWACDRLPVVYRPGWVPQRDMPKLPSMWRIVQHWLFRGIFKADPWFPHCFACWAEPPPQVIEGAATGAERWNAANSWLERGHLVNRARFGLDGVQNLVPLCHVCNRVMPVFDSPAAPGPVEWVKAGGWQQYYEWTADNEIAGRRDPPEGYGRITIPVTIEGGMALRSHWTLTAEQRRQINESLERRRRAQRQPALF